MDPIILLSAATTAFNAIKNGFAVGRDIESMYSDIGKWMGAISDINSAEKQIKNPSLLKKIIYSKSIEQEAIDIFAAKKKAQEMEKELKNFIQFQYGPSAWQELIAIQAKIRKERKQAKDAQLGLRKKVLEILVLSLLFIVGAFTIAVISWLTYQGVSNKL